MAHVWSPSLLSSLLMFSFFCCSATRPSNEILHLRDGSIPREHTNAAFNGKVVTESSSSGACAEHKCNNANGRKEKSTSTGIPTLMAQNPSKKVIQEPEIVAAASAMPYNFQRASMHVGTCDRQKCVRKRLVPKRPTDDQDSFVAYEDYRGPRRHPPRNN